MLHLKINTGVEKKELVINKDTSNLIARPLWVESEK